MDVYYYYIENVFYDLYRRKIALMACVGCSYYYRVQKKKKKKCQIDRNKCILVTSYYV